MAAEYRRGVQPDGMYWMRTDDDERFGGKPTIVEFVANTERIYMLGDEPHKLKSFNNPRFASVGAAPAELTASVREMRSVGEAIMARNGWAKMEGNDWLDMGDAGTHQVIPIVMPAEDVRRVAEYISNRTGIPMINEASATHAGFFMIWVDDRDQTLVATLFPAMMSGPVTEALEGM
jgi:hypothetical protein